MYQITLVMSLRSKPLGCIFLANCDLLLHQAVRRASRPHRPVNASYLLSLRSRPLGEFLPTLQTAKAQSLPLIHADRRGFLTWCGMKTEKGTKGARSTTKDHSAKIKTLTLINADKRGFLTWLGMKTEEGVGIPRFAREKKKLQHLGGHHLCTKLLLSMRIPLALQVRQQKHRHRNEY